MVPVVRGPLQLYPYALANVVVGLERCFHRRGAVGRSEKKE